MKLSEILSQNEWAYINYACAPYHINPKLIVAIGWHETHWGRLGMGRYGYHLGVSCWVRSDAQYQRDRERELVDEETYRKKTSGHLYCSLAYKGYQRQVQWAIEKFKDVIPYEIGYPHVKYIAEEIWKPGDPLAWAKSVWSIYKELDVDLPAEFRPSEPETIPSVDGDLPSAHGIIQQIAHYLEEIAKLLKEWRL